MRFSLLLLLSSVVVLAGACRKAATPVRAVGALEFDPHELQTPADPNPFSPRTFLATQVEVIQSSALLQKSIERGALADEMKGGQARLSAAPRGDALVLEVRAHHPDSRIAVQLCHAAMDAYLVHRIETRRLRLMRRQTALAEQFDSLADGGTEDQRAHLRAQMQAVALALTSDLPGAHVLERCAAR